MTSYSKKPIQTNEGLEDLNLIMNELTKTVPNKQKLKQFTNKYGINCNKDPNILINDIICFLDHQKYEKISDSEL